MLACVRSIPALLTRASLAAIAVLVMQACVTDGTESVARDSTSTPVPTATRSSSGQSGIDATAGDTDAKDSDSPSETPPAGEIVPDPGIGDDSTTPTATALSPEPPGTTPTAIAPSSEPPGTTPTPPESDQPVLNLIRESGQTIGHPEYVGMSLIGWSRYVYFQNQGPAGEVTLTVEIHGDRLLVETGADLIGNESPADAITKSFELDANEKYVATIEFGVGRGDGSNWVLNTANRVCGLNPLTGLMNANCVCAGSKLSIRVRSDPQGLEFQTPDMGATCGTSVQLRDVTIAVMPDPESTPEAGTGILARARNFAILEKTSNDREPEPAGIAFGPDGSVYVSVDETHQVLIFDSIGNLMTTIGSGDRAFGDDDEGELSSPAGITVDSEGNLYVAENSNNRFQAFTQSGELIFSQGEWGGHEGEFSAPHGIALSSENELYVADSGNHRIQVFDTTGKFLRTWGSKGDAEAEFDYPTGVAVSTAGLVYVADRNNHRIQVFTAEGTYQTGWTIKAGDQIATDPRGAIAVDSEGIVYVAARLGMDEHVIVSDSTGNYLGSWTAPIILVGGIAISPDSGSLYITDSMFGRIDILSVNLP